MGRKPREQEPGGIYHVYARGNRKALIYLDEMDRDIYLRYLTRVVERHAWRCLGYCLMPNHVHLLVELGEEATLAKGMHQLHTNYARYFNARHGEPDDGHVFQSRYGSVPITDDRQLLTVIGYLAVNPVAAGLCAAPEAWPWSGHRALAGDASAPAWLDVTRTWRYLNGFGGGDGAEVYRALIDARLQNVYASTSARKAARAAGEMNDAVNELRASVRNAASSRPRASRTPKRLSSA